MRKHEETTSLEHQLPAATLHLALAPAAVRCVCLYAHASPGPADVQRRGRTAHLRDRWLRVPGLLVHQAATGRWTSRPYHHQKRHSELTPLVDGFDGCAMMCHSWWVPLYRMGSSCPQKIVRSRRLREISGPFASGKTILPPRQTNEHYIHQS